LISRQVPKDTDEMNEQIDSTPENTPEVEPLADTSPVPAGEETAPGTPVEGDGEAVEVVQAVQAVDGTGDGVDDGDAGEDGEDEEGFSAPEEYVEREKGERRRVGSDVKIEDINYKNVPLLSRFLDRRGRIMSRRKTRVSAKMQRRIVREVKRARHLALLPYTADQTRQVRRRR
jgi:small subunit ribosomal protein S18